MASSSIGRVRAQCCMCSSDALKQFYRLDSAPVYMGATNQNPSLDVFEEQVWLLCEDCGTIQLKGLLELDLLYQQNHHREIVGETWKSHHQEFANFVVNSKASSILELGAGAGYLAGFVLQRTRVPYSVVEPDPGDFPEGVTVHKGYAEQNLHLVEEADAVVHSHLLEHLYDPRDFLGAIAERLTVGKKMIFSVPNFQGLFSQAGSANALNFEHTYYLDRNHLRQILSSLGFEIVSEVDFRQHSIFFEVIKGPDSDLGNPTLSRLKDLDLKLVASWDAIKTFCLDFSQRTASFQGPRYLFGAHVFSQAILQFLPETLFQAILDNDRAKQGNRLYGSRLEILDPSVLSKLECQVAVGVMASHYQAEITEQLRAFGSHVNVVGP